jgi:hypothetical protein
LRGALFDIQSSAYVPLCTESQGKRFQRWSRAIRKAILYFGPSFSSSAITDE